MIHIVFNSWIRDSVETSSWGHFGICKLAWTLRYWSAPNSRSILPKKSEVLANSYFLYVSVAYSMVLKDKRNHSFLVCNLRPVFEKVKFDVRRSLEPSKDLDGCFDPSLTALTKRSQTLSNDTCDSRILSAGVWDRLWPRKGLLRYTEIYFPK